MSEPPRTCNSCEHWSPYAPGLGECLDYARRRQAAWAQWLGSATIFNMAWPAQPAPDTEHTDTCDRWKALP